MVTPLILFSVRIARLSPLPSKMDDSAVAKLHPLPIPFSSDSQLAADLDDLHAGGYRTPRLFLQDLYYRGDFLPDAYRPVFFWWGTGHASWNVTLRRLVSDCIFCFLLRMREFGCEPGTAYVARSIDHDKNGGRNESQYEPDKPDHEQGGN